MILVVLGVSSLWQGWKAYNEPIPRFVVNYRGWSCPLLTLPYAGVWVLCMAVASLEPILPRVVMQVLGLIWLPSGAILFLGFLFWFPRFLLPPWYRRALKAGVPRHDPYAMGAFKALPVEKQKAAVQGRG
ncbi:hypothetical protein EII34_15245 [Arachnia propionica]|uniref:Uncharacterized protein n=1 Tax=Arachnia propionica TaxID=1750 RepID=A0A3P1T0Z4_9ACTN|nr:hypothetical protein [Arachnia propionica]RRD03167.1 hypothetical protein EII34_15245 [Arachnia propionica]